MNYDSRRRLSIDISNAQYLRLQKLIPHGLRVHVFSVLIDDLCDCIEKTDSRVFGSILSKSLTLNDISPTFSTEGDKK